MKDFLSCLVDCGTGSHLQDASGISSEDYLSVRPLGIPHFVGQKIQGSFRLGHVVNASGAAAKIGKRHFHQLDLRDGANQLSRRFADFLSVNEMAGILVGYAHRQWAERSYQAEVGEKFGNVANFS